MKTGESRKMQSLPSRPLLLGASCLTALVLLLASDFVADLVSKRSTEYLLFELLAIIGIVASVAGIVASVAAILADLWFLKVQPKKQQKNTPLPGSRQGQLEHSTSNLQERLIKKRATLRDLLNWQLIEWELTEAEGQIAAELLKGTAIKVIAGRRKTSEHTVRQQASTVYHKSGLQGRSEFSAFFLNELFATDEHEEDAKDVDRSFTATPSILM